MSDVQPPPAPLPRSSPVVPFGVAALCLIYAQIAPHIRAESFIAFLFSSVAYMALIVWFAASIGRALNRPRRILISGILAAVIAVPFRVMVVQRNPAAFSLYMSIPGLSDLLMVWLAGSVGAALSLLLRGANMIPPVAAVLALVDIWTVLLGGPVHQIMRSQSPTAKAVV